MLTLPLRSLAAALAPAMISVLHSPAASASTTDTVTLSLGAASAEPDKSAAVNPANSPTCASLLVLELDDILFPPLLINNLVVGERTTVCLSLRASSLHDPVQRDGADDDQAGDEFRVVQIDAVENQTAVNGGDDENAERGADDGAGAA